MNNSAAASDDGAQGETHDPRQRVVPDFPRKPVM